LNCWQFKHLRSGYERDQYLLEQACLKSVKSKDTTTPESPYMQAMTPNAFKNNCTGLAAILVEKKNPTIKTGAN
jgi:hypothetical protein